MRRAAVMFLAVWVGIGPGALCCAFGGSRGNCPPACVPCPPCPQVEWRLSTLASCEVVAPAAKPTPAEPEPVAAAPAVDSPPLVARPEQPAAFAPADRPEPPAADASPAAESDIEPLTPATDSAAGAPSAKVPVTPADATPPQAAPGAESEPSRYTDTPSFTQPSSATPTTAADKSTPTAASASAAPTTPFAEPATSDATTAMPETAIPPVPNPATDADAESMFDNPPDNRYAPPATPAPPPGGTTTPAGAASPAEVIPPTETQPEPTPTEPAPNESEEPDIFDLGQSTRVLDEPGGLSSAFERQWNDAAGQHSCSARLVNISADGIVLNRADGGEARVAFSSLSATDLQFVRRQIHARQLQLAAENAAIAGTPGK